MSKRIIYGVHIDNRVEEIPDVQAIFTAYGCYIKTRIGLHQVEDGMCSPTGLILLEMYGDERMIAEMKSKLTQHPGVTVKEMVFEE